MDNAADASKYRDEAEKQVMMFVNIRMADPSIDDQHRYLLEKMRTESGISELIEITRRAKLIFSPEISSNIDAVRATSLLSGDKIHSM